MCVICVKPKGVAMPPSTWIENMWYANPDGAGFMYATGKKVVIHKGYMTLPDFKNALNEVGDLNALQDLPLVMHFRIGTAGGNIPANTHPFPISDSIPMLQKLTCSTSLGIVHNGIIPITTRQQNISDTMEYIASQLAPLYRYDNEFYRSKDLLKMIGNATTSKLAFMNPAGEIFTIGNFIEESGLLFSNSTYESGIWYRRVPVKAYGLSTKAYGTLYDDWNFGLERGEYVLDLMPLDPACYIVDMDTGTFYDADMVDAFIDNAGFLYVYDDFFQCCISISGDYGVYDAHGNSVKYDKNEASAMIIEDECVTLAEYYHDIVAIEEDNKEEAERPGDETSSENTDETYPF